MLASEVAPKYRYIARALIQPAFWTRAITCFELGELGIAGFLQLAVAAAQTEVLGVEHLGVEVLPDLLEVQLGQDAFLGLLRRRGMRLDDRDLGAPHGRRGKRDLRGRTGRPS